MQHQAPCLQTKLTRSWQRDAITLSEGGAPDVWTSNLHPRCARFAHSCEGSVCRWLLVANSGQEVPEWHWRRARVARTQILGWRIRCGGRRTKVARPRSW